MLDSIFYPSKKSVSEGKSKYIHKMWCGLPINMLYQSPLSIPVVVIVFIWEIDP